MKDSEDIMRDISSIILSTITPLNGKINLVLITPLIKTYLASYSMYYGVIGCFIYDIHICGKTNLNIICTYSLNGEKFTSYLSIFVGRVFDSAYTRKYRIHNILK